MTTDSTQELDEILFEAIEAAATYTHNVTAEEADYIQNKTKQAILDWHNKQMEAYHNELTDNEKKVWIYADDLEKRKARAVAAVLDRLLHEYELDVDSKWFSSSGGMVDLASAIEAERNKLKESSND